MEFKAATCLNCGSNIQVPDNQEQVYCTYCGSSILVKDAAKALSLPEVKNVIKKATAFIETGNIKEAKKKNKRKLAIIYSIVAAIFIGVIIEGIVLDKLDNSEKNRKQDAVGKDVQGQPPGSVGYRFLAEGRTMSKAQAYQAGLDDRDLLLNRLKEVIKVKGAEERVAEIASLQNYNNAIEDLLCDNTISARRQGISEDKIAEYNRARRGESPSIYESTQPTKPAQFSPEPPIFYSVIGIAARDALNVRSGPGVSYDLADKLPNGYDKIQIIGAPVLNDTTEWVHISFENRTGWVNKIYLKDCRGNDE